MWGGAGTKAEKTGFMERENAFPFWVVIMMGAWLILSQWFFSTGFSPRWDVPYHMNRVEGIKEGLLAGQFPVRVHAYQMNGFGTLDGIFYPDTFLYFPAFLRLFDVPVEIAYNAYWIFAILFGLLASWYGYAIWLNSVKRGAVAAMIYHSTYWFLWCMWEGPGSCLAYWFLPMFFASLLCMLTRNDGKRYWTGFVLAFTVIAQAHVVNAIFCLLATLVCCLVFHRRLLEPDRRMDLLKAGVFSVLLNLWRGVPFLYFYRTIDFHLKNATTYTQSGYASLQYTTSSLSALADSQFILGGPVVLLTLFFLVKHPREYRIPYLLTVCIVGFLLAMNWSRFPWESIEKMWGGGALAKLQTPVRFLPLAEVFLCRYLGTFVVEFFRGMPRILPAIVGIACCVIGICSTSSFVQPEGGRIPVGNYQKGDYRYVGKLPSYTIPGDVCTYVQEDYIYNDVTFFEMKNRNGTIPGPEDFYSDAYIYDIYKQGTTALFSYEAAQETSVQLPLFYYPGYVAEDDKGNLLILQEGEHHFMQVVLPQGSARVQVHYAGLWFLRIFDAVSLAALFAFVLIWRRECREERDLWKKIS